MERATLHRLAGEVGENEALDPPAQRLLDVARGAIGQGRLHDALRGSFLGHPLHPLLTDLPIGSWTSAMVLDLAGGRGTEKAARRLIGTGILASLPTAVTGAAEWSDNGDRASTRRIGLVHAAANVTALSLYSASYLARRRGGSGRALALMGGAALAVGGHLGGHLAYVNGAGVEGRDERIGVEKRDAADAVRPPTDTLPG